MNKIAHIKAWRSKDAEVNAAVRAVMDRLRVRTLDDFAAEHPKEFDELHDALADMFDQDQDVARYDAALRSHLRGQFDRIDDIEAYKIALVKAIETGVDPINARRELDALEAWLEERNEDPAQ